MDFALKLYAIGAVVASAFYAVPLGLGIIEPNEGTPPVKDLLIGWVFVTAVWPYSFYRTAKLMRARGTDVRPR